MPVTSVSRPRASSTEVTLQQVQAGRAPALLNKAILLGAVDTIRDFSPPLQGLRSPH